MEEQEQCHGSRARLSGGSGMHKHALELIVFDTDLIFRSPSA